MSLTETKSTKEQITVVFFGNGNITKGMIAALIDKSEKKGPVYDIYIVSRQAKESKTQRYLTSGWQDLQDSSGLGKRSRSNSCSDDTYFSDSDEPTQGKPKLIESLENLPDNVNPDFLIHTSSVSRSKDSDLLKTELVDKRSERLEGNIPIIRNFINQVNSLGDKRKEGAKIILFTNPSASFAKPIQEQTGLTVIAAGAELDKTRAINGLAYILGIDEKRIDNLDVYGRHGMHVINYQSIEIKRKEADPTKLKDYLAEKLNTDNGKDKILERLESFLSDNGLKDRIPSLNDNKDSYSIDKILELFGNSLRNTGCNLVLNESNQSAVSGPVGEGVFYINNFTSKQDKKITAQVLNDGLVTSSPVNIKNGDISSIEKPSGEGLTDIEQKIWAKGDKLTILETTKVEKALANSIISTVSFIRTVVPDGWSR